MKAVSVTVSLFLFVGLDAFASEVHNTVSWRQHGSTHVILAGEVDLPSDGVWTVESPDASEAVVSLHLNPPREALQLLMGKRMRAVDGEKETESSKVPPKTFPYRILAVRAADRKDRLSLQAENTISGTRTTIEWNHAQAAIGTDDLVTELTRIREATWQTYALGSDSSLLAAWLGDGADSSPDRGSNRRGESTSVFGVLGGRAAVRETLQMDAINREASKAGEAPVAIDSIRGVTVQSHPYEEMLKGQQGGAMSLANVAPRDRFFVYVAKPDALLPLLDDGADFMSRLGGAVTGRSVKYYLKSRYLARLGLSEKWLNMLLKSKAVAEMALIAPDLFFIDGTDITVVSRVSNPAAVSSLLRVAGVLKLSGDQIAENKTTSGKSVYWVMRNDLLVVATSRSELDRVIALQSGNGEGSLGKSAEFRYMLTQLAPTEDSRAFVFFSDPFIRRLVGPQVKIAQLRRMVAREEMERITGRALLACLDGMPHASLEELAAKNYIPGRYVGADYSINDDLVVSSRRYGTLDSMKTLLETPVVEATAGEARAYASYVENYSRFWRQFFDPIAIRLDDTGEGGLELTTFILPLIDNSIYSSVKQFIASREDGTELRIPKFSPAPVVTLSVNLKEQAWGQITEGLSELFTKFAHANPAMIDDFGPGIHLMVHDADPVIALGSGDVFGAFGSGSTMLGRNSEMMFIPVALSVLTRPCTLAIETRDQEKTLRYLRQTAATSYRRGGRGWGDDDVGLGFYKITGKDAWVCNFDLFGMMKLRYGLEVRDGFLLVRNIPWADNGQIIKVEGESLNGARLEAVPASCIKQLNGLVAAAEEHERAAAMRGAGYLYPLVASGRASIQDAAGVHAKLLGCTPIHPPGGSWVWKDGQVRSTVYGSVFQQEQPDPVTESKGGGLMDNIDRLSLEMQFEDTGLRTRVRWKTR